MNRNYSMNYYEREMLTVEQQWNEINAGTNVEQNAKSRLSYFETIDILKVSSVQSDLKNKFFRLDTMTSI